MRQLSQKKDGTVLLRPSCLKKKKTNYELFIFQRCDGTHPICGQCDRASRAEDCEYVNGQQPSKVQLLEETISRLEARIQEFQNQQGAPSREHHTQQAPAAATMRLHQPYGVSDSSYQDPPRQIAENLYDLFYQLWLFY